MTFFVNGKDTEAFCDWWDLVLERQRLGIGADATPSHMIFVSRSPVISIHSSRLVPVQCFGARSSFMCVYVRVDACVLNSLSRNMEEKRVEC